MKPFSYAGIYVVFSIILMAGFLLFGQPVNAQFSLFDSTSVLDVTLETTPENPAPNSEVFAELESFNLDLDRMLITWFVNGIQEEKGVGEKTLIFNVGDLGSTTTVEAIVRLDTGENVSRTLIITPGSVDLLWESVDGYRPPFYKGKVLPVRESTIKITAIPQVRSEGALVSPKQFKYTWEHDFRVQGSLSGFGQDSFTVVNQTLNPRETVGVQIVNRDASQTTEKQLTVPIFEPEILIYAVEDGVRSRQAVERALGTGSEETFVAEPYFFSVAKNDPRVLSYEWFAGDRRLEGTSGQKIYNQIVLQNPRQAGIIPLSVRIEHPINLFQIASKLFSVEFKN